MDKRTIYSKTGKGSLEINKKSIKLASDERQTLILVDGKSNLGEIEDKLSRVQPMRLRAIIDKLVEYDLIREFVSKQGPDSLMATPGQLGMSIMEVEGELDFTALAPTSTANTVKEVEERRVAALKAEEDARIGREANERRAAAEASARAAADAQARARAEEEARKKAEHDTRIRAIEDDARRKVEEEMRVKAEAEARRRAEEEARRNAAEDARRKGEEEARRKADAEAHKKEEEQARKKAEEVTRMRAEEEARKKSADDARRRAEEEAKLKAEEEMRKKAEEKAQEAARMRTEQEAFRKAEEEERKKAEEEARRKAEAVARLKAEEEARRKAEEEARRRAEEEARKKAEAEARRKAEEEARRKAEEEARRKAEEEARRRAEEEARRKAEEEARRKAEEEARRRAEEEARRRAEEDERRRAEEEARRKAEEEARFRAEAEERRRAEAAADAQTREQTERAREESELRERLRREEDAKRAAILEEKRRAESEATQRADAEAARYTAALSPHLERAAPAEEAPDLDFNSIGGERVDLKPLAGGGPDTFADTSGAAISQLDYSEGEASTPQDRKKESRKELEREAKESAKAAAKAQKDAEREAKRQAKESKVTIRRGGGGGLGIGKFLAVLLLVAVGGGVGYLYFMPVDKAEVEKEVSLRLGEPVKVGTVKFEPFPPQLKLTGVTIGDITLPQVLAVPDPGSLASDQKIWKSIDVTGLTVNPAQAKKLAALALMEPPRAPGGGPTMTIQRVRALGTTVTGTPVPLPAFNAVAVFGPAGALKEATLALPDGKAQVQVSPDEKGWLLDFESRGVAWPLGPKVAWESLRAKGLATANGLKFDSIAFTHFAGTATAAGNGELSWGNAWKFNATFDIGGMETDSIAQAFYGASPVSGTMDGKLAVGMSAPSLPQLTGSAQIDGDVVVNKATVKNLDLARSAQAGTPTAGQTRFSEFSCALSFAGGRLQVKNVKGVSGLLNVTGGVDVAAEGNLNGALNVDIGMGSNRAKAAIRVGGTMADPKVSR